MDILNQIIAQMSKEELRYYKLISTKSHDHEQRKDRLLFDYMRRSGDKYTERKILKKLYPEGEKNAFYRLKNRLFNELGKGLLLLHWEEDEDLQTLHLLALAVHFRKRQFFEAAEYYLKKAEKRAGATGNSGLLDFIYGEFIQLSFQLVHINPEEYIQKREENRSTLNRLREMDNIIAVLTWRIKMSGNLADKNESYSRIIEKAIAEFSASPELSGNFQFRARVYSAVTKLLIQSHDFVALEEYVRTSLADFQQLGFFSRVNHDLKLQMLTNLMNASVKNKKYDQALEVAESLHEAMNDFNRLLYDKYIFFYYNSLAGIWAKKDIGKAISILEEMMGIPAIAKNPINSLFTCLNLAVTCYGGRKPANALKYLVQLRLLDAWKETEEAFRMKVGIFELMATWDKGEEETFDYKLRQFHNEFDSLLENPGNDREKRFLQLLRWGNDRRKGKSAQSLDKAVREFPGLYPDQESDFFGYAEWLKEKIPVK